MRIRFFEWVARRRVAVLAVTLLVAVVLEAFRRTNGDHYYSRSFFSLNVLPMVLLLAVGFAGRSFRPAKLVARPELPAFDVPADPGMILCGAAFSFMYVQQMGGLIHEFVEDRDLWFLMIFGVLWIGLLVPFWRAALGRIGVRLRPDGIVDRQLHGSLFVPWEALALPHPAFAYDPQRVTLFLAHPGLVRRRGLRMGSTALLPAVGVNAELLARAIHEYAHRPELRPAIGSAAELARFMAIPQVNALVERVPAAS
ncbi:hypothetical protein [Actinoplanes regularis]|uniref:Uncharacterized protein n=1 Tax=Actinoplanes regularis TaxID=52697 RepID=A0A238YC44_9ACTN|nr:hypothetical protein [Actinoplanes regularis]SNR68164.1 hypothetical protein SAMN06264365_104407 [Actinoplanes regularis]